MFELRLRLGTYFCTDPKQIHQPMNTCVKNQPMKTRIKNLFLLPALIAGLGLIPAGRLTAQNFTTLHSFTGRDGAGPPAGLILSSHTLYGTAHQGGSSANGTVFAVNTDGTGFTNLHSFTAVGINSDGVGTNSDGAFPFAGLVLSNNTLYGTAPQGGSSGQGTVFKVNIDGSDFTTLHAFTAVSGTYPFNNSDGACPHGSLILSGTTLYGTAPFGGSLGYGTVFKVNTDATGFTTLQNFTNGGDGATPWAGLVLSGNTLYGTTSGGGSGAGTVFALNTNGAGFTTLHSFTATSGSFPGPYTNSDGASPEAGLILSGNILYGTTQYGGSSANGTVFALNNDGTGFKTLHSFMALNTGTNSDGAFPGVRLILSGNTLYGTTYYGGSSGNGTVFALYTNGTGFTTLYSFTGRSDGANPVAGSIFSNHTLYGTAYGGATAGNGTVFSLSLGPVSAPQLTIISSGANVILTWPTNATGFTLQSTTNLVSPAIWTNVSPGPVVLNRQNTVTNPISGTRQFYRLSQ